MKIVFLLLIWLLPICTKNAEDQGSHNISTAELQSTNTILDEHFCRTPKNEIGSCLGLVECNSLLKELHLKQHVIDTSLREFVAFLRLSNKACAVPPPTVCCPIDKISKLPIAMLPTKDDSCGVPNWNEDRIVGGSEARIGAWPWIALLGYENIFGEVKFRCGGVLITLGHVLTAAHCILNDLKFARLGEHNISTTLEAFHIDVKIAKMERHPDYSRKDGHSDIGILYLQQNLPYTKAIKPVCLPPKDELFRNVFPFVAGWGKTIEDGNSSDVLHDIRIPIYDNSVCRSAYTKLNKSISDQQFDNAIICAGDLRGIVDTCQGDSGGPLMLPVVHNTKTLYVAIGIVSYSIGCARSNRPGVYTSISHFKEWIEKKVAETSTTIL